jgi:hypothetical protein
LPRKAADAKIERDTMRINLTLGETVFAVLFHIFLIALVFLAQGSSPSALSMTVVGVALAGSAGILWRGYHRARSIKSIEYHYRKIWQNVSSLRRP